MLAALATLLITLGSYRQVYKASSSPPPSDFDIADCIAKVEGAIDAIRPHVATDPNYKEGVDSPNTINFLRCQAIAAQALKDDPKLAVKHPGLAANIQDTVNSIGTCQLGEPTAETAGTAGRELKIPVQATIPLGGFSADFHAEATLSGGGVSAAVALTPPSTSKGTWSGTLVVPGNSSKNVADGAQSTIVMTAAGTAPEFQPGQLDGKCPLTLVRVGDTCRFTCSVSGPKAVVVWKVPPKITAKLSAAITDATNANLSWTSENATSITLTGRGIPGGSFTTPQKSGSFPVKRGLQDETYTLTASAPDTDTVTDGATVKGTTDFQVTVSAGGSQFTTASSVAVTGTVTPAPPAGTLVAIGVNGVPITKATVAGGSYSATVQLSKTTPTGKLRLSNPGQVVGVCGARQSPIIMFNDAGPDDVANVVTAAVVNADGVANSNIATVQIAHAAQVTSAKLTWTGQCPGQDKDFGSGQVLRAGQSIQFGTADCGVPCPVPDPPPVPCTATARAEVLTTVGSYATDGFWNINVH